MIHTGRASDASESAASVGAAAAGHTTVEESPLLHSATLYENTYGDAAAPRSLDAGITLTCIASAMLVCLAPLQYGYHIAELNTPRKIITSCDKDAVHWASLPMCLPMNDAMYSLATSIFAVGGLLGSLSAGWMAEKWGRRGALLINNVPFVLGPLLMALAVSPAMLIAGRFVSGLGSGAAVVIAPMYLSEVAPLKYRGTLNMFNQLSIVLGILITLTVGMLANEGPYWRISVGAGLLLACLHLAVSSFAVESPRYLWSRNRCAEACAVLRRLRHTSNIEDEVRGWSASPVQQRSSSVRAMLPERRGILRSAAEADDGFSEVSSSADSLHNGQTGIKPDNGEVTGHRGDALQVDSTNVTIFNIFRFAQYRKPWMLVLLLQFGQQLSGINTVFYFSSSVLEKMFSSQVSSILTMMIGVLNVVATASGALVVDRFGRRPLLFSSMAAMGVSVMLLGLGLGLKLNMLAAVSLYLVVASFAPGYGPVPFLLGTEFFDIRAAGAGGSWALAANWIGTFIVATAFLPLQNLIGEWVFAIFVGALVICGITFYFHVPETKGRTIEDIARKFK
ncbi:hypothetical protein LPJ66_002162 [Kickxella alabastrina]|uniref:Uncharacterized protein n=1 Tax=Kickxella alabastrina TaxID=61397 RepID=A0ACC1IRB2_9FUNG|nr:hypothetical protein LPJ66_002162 [Kickxella alabastrina]